MKEKRLGAFEAEEERTKYCEQQKSKKGAEKSNATRKNGKQI